MDSEGESVGARKGEKRRSARIWMAMVDEADGSLWFYFEAGDRDLLTFRRLLRRRSAGATGTTRSAIFPLSVASRGREAI